MAYLSIGLGIVSIIAGFFISRISIKNMSEGAYIATSKGTDWAKRYDFNSTENRAVELEAYLREYVKLMFQFDKTSFFDNTRMAVNLGGTVANNQLNWYKENRYHDLLTATNSHTIVNVDSIRVDLSKYPYKSLIYSRWILISDDEELVQNLYVYAEIRNLELRTSSNTRAFELEAWSPFDLKTIE
jgi:hypothetical protein